MLLERDKEIDILAGKDVSPETLQNVLGYAMKQRKPLILRRCENLSNLRVVDHMVVTANAFIEMNPVPIEIPEDSDEDEEYI